MYYQVKNSSKSLSFECFESNFAVEKDDIQDIQAENHWNPPDKSIFYQKWDVFNLSHSKFEFPGNARNISGIPVPRKLKLSGKFPTLLETNAQEQQQQDFKYVKVRATWARA